MNTTDLLLESLFKQARLTNTPSASAPYGFSTRIAALGLEAQAEEMRAGLAWRMAWTSLLPALACLTFILLSDGRLEDLWSPDLTAPSFNEELFLP
jgi:hypothetical protein